MGPNLRRMAAVSGVRNLLARRSFLRLGAALTGSLALGKPEHAEAQPASPPADAPWSHTTGPGVVDRPYGRPADFEAGVAALGADDRHPAAWSVVEGAVDHPSPPSGQRSAA